MRVLRRLLRRVLEGTSESKCDNDDNDENVPFPFLKKIKSEHPKNLYFEQLNVSSIIKKFESIQEIIQNNFDMFPVCETKIDSSFPNNFDIFLLNNFDIFLICETNIDSSFPNNFNIFLVCETKIDSSFPNSFDIFPVCETKIDSSFPNNFDIFLFCETKIDSSFPN